MSYELWPAEDFPELESEHEWVGLFYRTDGGVEYMEISQKELEAMEKEYEEIEKEMEDLEFEYF